MLRKVAYVKLNSLEFFFGVLYYGIYVRNFVHTFEYCLIKKVNDDYTLNTITSTYDLNEVQSKANQSTRGIAIVVTKVFEDTLV